MRGPGVRPIVIAAGGTGGHFFPAVALARALAARGQRPVLMTDARTAGRDGDVFESRVVLQGGGVAGRGFARAAAGIAGMAVGVVQARAALARMRAAVVVGFGGYPSVAPVLAARTLGVPVVLHEQNAVLGRANRFLARFADGLAVSFDMTARVPASVVARVTGNPVRPGFAFSLFVAPAGEVCVLVVGGSLGARVLSDVVPAALATLRAAPSTMLRMVPLPRCAGEDPIRSSPGFAGGSVGGADGGGTRLRVAQQCRPEDIARVRAAYDAVGIAAEIAPFFDDMPKRIADAHLVIARAGASTCAELTVTGRPAILIPLPGAIDDHQAANAAALPATVLTQPTPERLRDAIASMLPRLAEHAAAMAARGWPDAAERLADMVLALAPTDMPPLESRR